MTQSLAMVQSFVLGALAFTGHPPILALYGTALPEGFCLPSTTRYVARSVAAAAWGALAERRSGDPSTPLSRADDAASEVEAAGTDLAI